MSCALSKQVLEFCGMSSRCRINWKILVETFLKGDDVSEDMTVLERSPLCRIKGISGLEFSLELLVKRVSGIFEFVVRVSPQTKPFQSRPELCHAFVVIRGVPYHLEDCVKLGNHSFRSDVLTKEENKVPLSKGETLTVHCLICIKGIAEPTLTKELKDIFSDNMMEYKFVPRMMEDCDVTLSDYYFDGKIPIVSIDSANSILTKIRNLPEKLPELRALISKNLAMQLSRDTVTQILRISMDHGMFELQKSVLSFMEKHDFKGSSDSV